MIKKRVKQNFQQIKNIFCIYRAFVFHFYRYSNWPCIWVTFILEYQTKFSLTKLLHTQANRKQSKNSRKKVEYDKMVSNLPCKEMNTIYRIENEIIVQTCNFEFCIEKILSKTSNNRLYKAQINRKASSKYIWSNVFLQYLRVFSYTNFITWMKTKINKKHIVICLVF